MKARPSSFLFLFLLISSFAFADSGPIAASKEMWQIINNTPKTAGVEEIERSLRNEFDVDRFSELALYKFWPSWSDKQKQEFKDHFLARLSRQLNGAMGGVEYKKTQVSFKVANSGDKSAMVTATTTHNNKSLTMDLFLIEKNNRWFVYDMNVDGVNLIRNYRADFNKVIRLHGYEGLIARLKR